jgi:4-amino-4-deoxy-L-arabinose transferase-like glycosyltransferase
VTNHATGHLKVYSRWCQSYLFPVLVILLALALYLYGLDSKSLWYDELGTLTNAGWHGSWLDALRNPLTIPTVPKPPLYFLVTHLSLSLDSSTFATRLPSAVFAALTIPLVYVIGRAFFGRQTGLLAALLLAIAPLHIRYAQEARMYAMLTFFSMLSLYLFWQAIRTNWLRWWLGFALVTLLSLYTFQFALLSLGVITLFALWLLIQRKARPDFRIRFPFQGWHLLVGLGLILLLYLPMAPFLLEGAMSAEGFGGEVVPVYGELRWDLDSLLGAARLFSGGNTLELVLYVCSFVLALVVLWVELRDIKGRSAAGPRELGVQSSLPLDRQEQVGWRVRTRYAVLLLLMWLVLPWVILLSIPSRHGVRIRYLLFVLPVYLILVAHGLWLVAQWLTSWLANLKPLAISRRAAGITVTLVLLGLFVGFGVPTVAAYYAETKQRWRDATDLVLMSAETGEPVFVSREHHRTGVLFYANELDEDANPLADEIVRILPKDPTEDLLPAEIDRGWLIVPVREEYLPGGELDDQLKPGYQLSESTIFDSSNVPEDSPFIGPIFYRSLIVMQIERIREPSIRFWSDDLSVPLGSCTSLHWEVENVREVYLDGDGVVGRGEREVCPTATTAYELQLFLNYGTTALETIEIEVVSP